MPRKPRLGSTSGYYHFINRGVNHAPLFYFREDYEFYRSLWIEACDRFGIKVFHYCYLTNHTHFLLHAGVVSDISRMAHFLHRRYALYLCRKHQLAEQIFKKHFVSIPIKDDLYLLECARYIELNPVRAGLVQKAGDYVYSSYAFYARGASDDLLTTNPLYEGMGFDSRERQAAYRAFVQSPRMTETELSTFPF